MTSNHWPICSIPNLYKLFSRLLFKRLQPTLDDNQTADQAGFRRGYSTTDHLHTFQQLQQSNPLYDSVPQDELEDELDPWVDYIARATHEADDLMVANGITSTAGFDGNKREVLPSTTRDARQNSSPTKQKGYRKQGRLVKRWEDDMPSKVHRDNNDLTNDTT